MIKYIFALLLTIGISCTGQSQITNSDSSEKYPLVQVKNWGANTIMFSENFWESVKENIVQQIGEEEFEQVKANSGFDKIPKEMSIWDGRIKKDKKELYSKLDKLKLHKIATFTNTGWKGGKIAILKCLYEENKSWDNNIKWETVYFILNEDAVEQK